MRRAHVSPFYSEYILAEVKNEPNDNDYDYFFSVSGNYPEGLEFVYNHRKVIIEGTPEKVGRYTFRVHLDVDPLTDYWEDAYNEDRLCTDHTSKSYTLIVN